MTFTMSKIIIAVALLATAGSGIAAAQSMPLLPPSKDEGFSVVRGAPYSGEGTTTVNMTLMDGTRINRQAIAKLYRDSAGRIRREQTIMGLAELNPANDSAVLVTIVDPVEGFIYALNPVTREARRIPFRGGSRLAAPTSPQPMPPPPPPPPPPGSVQAPIPPQAMPNGTPMEETEVGLGTKQIEGVTATGRRSTLTIPAGQIGNDRPIAVVDERWESPELKLLLLSVHHDPRTGDVQFRLANLQRTEPSPDLFKVPADYTVVDGPPPPPPPPPRPHDEP
jgi:hypothetical protein